MTTEIRRTAELLHRYYVIVTYDVPIWSADDGVVIRVVTDGRLGQAITRRGAERLARRFEREHAEQEKRP